MNEKVFKDYGEGYEKKVVIIRRYGQVMEKVELNQHYEISSNGICSVTAQ
ncbi:hypothetical protein GCM10026983_18640 [Gracilibacillus alcaliphilus]